MPKDTLRPLGPQARRLVQVGRSALRPTDADRARIDAALRAQLGPAMPDPNPTTPDAPAQLAARHLGGSAAPLAAAAAVSVALVAVLSLLASRSPTQTRQPAATSAAISRQPPVSEVKPVEPEIAPAPTKAVQQVPPAHPEPDSASPDAARRPHRKRRAADALAQEVALLSRATRELRSGRAPTALVALEEHQRRFPSGALAEERHAAKAQALCSLGRLDEGRAELALLARGSPAAGRARQICTSPLDR